MKPPLIIVGSGRSGTNALRDALTSLSAFSTWPCDEINYIWRHHNRDAPTDELLARHCRPEVAAFIRKNFRRLQHRDPDSIVVEKTCANSLRVPFVQAALPEARFVHIVRDGRDVVPSAMDRWGAAVDLPYLLRKARFVPPSDLLVYAGRYGASRLGRRHRGGTLRTWGPKFAGLTELVEADAPLDQVCAAQWAACVGAANSAFSEMAPESFLEVRYEKLVAQPAEELERIVSFADTKASDLQLETAARSFRPGSVGTWRSRLTATQVERVVQTCGSELSRLGYLQ